MNPNPQKTNEIKKEDLFKAMNIIFGSLEKAQSKGAFTFIESSNTYSSMLLVKKYIEDKTGVTK